MGIVIITKIVNADYLDPHHQTDIVALMKAYALDPMGGGKALAEEAINHLGDELAKRPYAFTLIAYVDDRAAGLVTCFELFSTFACKPLINIHDVVVLKEYRGRGLSKQLLERVEKISRDKQCCKLTLEVLSGNAVARSAYQDFGFSGYQLSPETGTAEFWQKVL